MTIRNRMKRLEALLGNEVGLRPLAQMTDAELERIIGIRNPTDAQLEELTRRHSDERIHQCAVARFKGRLADDAYLPEMTAAEKAAVEALWVYSPGLKQALDCNSGE